jgi:FKBP-type peptidyl-prolyl cis-trans isomerase FklB
MVEGDDWMVFIPYTLAYGSEGSGEIPGYSTLQFRIHMVRWYESGSGVPGRWE